MRFWLLPTLILNVSLVAPAQAPVTAASTDSTPTVKVDVSLVPVRVVVRDSKGQAVAGLKKDDFQILDQGKPQSIQQFSLEQLDDRVTSAPAGTTSSAPQAYFTAYLFDDLHLAQDDLLRARNAANRQIGLLSSNRERFAILTTSGRNLADFTAPEAKLRETLAAITAQGQKFSECPAISYYMASLIEKGDREAIRIAEDDALYCAFRGDSRAGRAAEELVNTTVNESAQRQKIETAHWLRTLKALVGAMSTAPGRRLIVLVSPGFFLPDEAELTEITNLAVRSDISIAAIDPRGPLTSVETDRRKMVYAVAEQDQDAALLQGLTEATGGIFFHNSNDTDEGFHKVGDVADYSYTLAFSPHDVKFDGRFHKLKITLPNHPEFAVFARRGYFAPKQR